MMDIAIDDSHLAHQPLIQCHSCGHSNIIEHAEAGPALIVGMMAATREIDGRAVFQRQPCREASSADRGPRARRDGRRHLEADAAGRLRIQRGGEHAGHIGRVMGKVQPAFWRMGRDNKSLTLLAQEIRHERVFAHRETMAVRHAGGVIIGMVDKGQGHHPASAPAGLIVKQRRAA